MNRLPKQSITHINVHGSHINKSPAKLPHTECTRQYKPASELDSRDISIRVKSPKPKTKHCFKVFVLDASFKIIQSVINQSLSKKCSDGMLTVKL